jgi:hypothetical protein
MKRSSLLAIGLVVLAAVPACRREDRVGTTNTTSATVTPTERPIVAAPAPATPEPPPASAGVSSLPNARSTAATSLAASGTSATDATASAATASASAAASATAAATPAATAPIDGRGPSRATNPDVGTPNGIPIIPAPQPFGNANATSTTTTTGAPLVAPGLYNGVTDGVGNIGTPLNYATPMSTAPRPVGGAMRPGAAGNADTTSGAR